MTKTEKMKTYADLKKQIEALSLEAEAVKRKEIEGVIARIQEAIQAYGLTAEDLGLAKKSATRVGGKGVRHSKALKSKKKTTAPAGIAYRDESGNTWVGRGPRPQWLRDALAAGKTLADFKAG